jgi:hypothetical protein
MSSSNNEYKVEKKQTSSKIEIKKRKLTESEQNLKKPKVEIQNKEPIKNFEKILITEKDNFNKSQKNFLEPNKIKIGER